MRWNAPYAAFANALGFSARHLPASWRDLPAVPTVAFKESALASFEARSASVFFETSGTTGAGTGRHYFEATSLVLYDAALLAGFDHFMLSDTSVPLRYLLLVPDRATSSLSYMMRRVSGDRGDGDGGTYVDTNGEALDLDRFAEDLGRAYDAGAAVCIAGTAFAFAALLERLAGAKLMTLPGSRVMETGGFKGHAHTLDRDGLYSGLSHAFGIPPERIVAEYGMTELTSQYYDARWSRGPGERVKTGPPWLRPLIVDAAGKPVADGEVGVLRHVDLANRGSALAVQTEDLAMRVGEDAFVLLGRDPDARLRGCSLDVEDLLARRS